MKRITTMQSPVNIHHLHELLERHLNEDFARQRQQNIAFDIEEKEGNAIEISKPDLYEGYLFRIEGHGNDLHVHKTENYTDDVNVLTIEEQLDRLFFDYMGPRSTSGFIVDES